MKENDLIVCDFESYYDSDFTLKGKGISTSEYIRDSRFEIISCSIKVNNRVPFCYFGKEAVAKALAKIKWDKATLLAHHTHFDGLILSHHFGHVPKRYADTLSMARALHPKGHSNSLEDVAIMYNKLNKLVMPDFKGKHVNDLTKAERKAIAEYNNRDVESCYEIYQEMLKNFPVPELDLIDITVRMFADPVLKVNLAKAKRELKREQTAKYDAIKAAGVDAEVLSSGPKFTAALEAAGVDVPTKPSPSIPNKVIPAIAKSDEDFQALLTHPDPKVVALVEGRLAVKSTIGESRALRLINHAKPALPVYLNYALAHTLRWTGGDKLNTQNFKQKQKVGGELRQCITAPSGQVQVVVDAAQIEARVVAWLANEEWILEAFREKRDLYSEFASTAYGRIITKADKEERFVGKTCVLGLGFGMGGPKLQTSVLTKSIEQGLDPIRLPLEVCSTLVGTYRKECENIVALWATLNNAGITSLITGDQFKHKCVTFGKEHVRLPNGLALLYPGVRGNIAKMRFGEERVFDASYQGSKSRSKLYGGLLTENIVQALARVIVADVMRIIAQQYRVVMMTHDEIVFLANKSEGQKALDWAIGLMSVSPSWAPDLPLSAEGGYGVEYVK